MNDSEVKALHDLYQNRSDFTEFFQALRSRERNRSEITVENFLKAQELCEPSYTGGTLTKKKARDFFNALEEVGLGKLIIGRRGAKTRFVWKVSLREVSRAIEEIDTQDNPLISKSENSDIGRELGHSTDDVSPESFRHKYILRQNCIVTIDLPTDLTVTEAERLSGFIKTLPINATKEEKVL